jgi:hypothetical protein
VLGFPPCRAPLRGARIPGALPRRRSMSRGVRVRAACRDTRDGLAPPTRPCRPTGLPTPAKAEWHEVKGLVRDFRWDSEAPPTTELASVEECSQPEFAIGAPSPPCRLSAWGGVSDAFSRKHRSTEASSVVAGRRCWVAFWWRTSIDGGKPRRGGKSPRASLTSHHSGQGRRGAIGATEPSCVLAVTSRRRPACLTGSVHLI